MALAAFCVPAAGRFHVNIADRYHILHFEKDLAVAGGRLVLALAGGGPPR